MSDKRFASSGSDIATISLRCGQVFGQSSEQAAEHADRFPGTIPGMYSVNRILFRRTIRA
jgi:hypothetical protein